ncbi:MAG: SDR family oxidoreductase [Gammaproteobacteria bacterium]|nr:SDR family oxidoreductase [Gammaproteobacteria bacterium]
MTQEHILVAGASGVVGYAAMKLFAERGCRVTAVSRRPPLNTFGAEHLAVDLMDAEASRAAFGKMTDVTRVVYAALYEKPGLMPGWVEADHIETNRRMFENLLEPVAASSRGLRHVSLLQGTKAYGAHVRQIPLPAREHRDELHSQPNFYWEQERYIRERQSGSDWQWTIFRPQLIFGMALGAAMNLIPPVGVYAALLREQGEPLHYPGGPSTFVIEAVDADLLARTMAWAGDDTGRDAAANEIFNVTNGDVFVWREVWPAIADAFGMAVGEERPRSMASALPEQAGDWDAVRDRYRLRAPELSAFVGESHHYMDFTLTPGVPERTAAALVSTIHLRQAGFAECMDTEAMFRKWIRIYQGEGLLPPVNR